MDPTTNEQAETATPEASNSGGVVSREDLIAAVRAAGGTESVDVAAEEQAAQARAAEAPPPAAPAEEEEEEPRIASILKQREKAFQEREAARNQAQELLAEAQQRAQRMLEEARLRAEQEWQNELARRRQQFLSSPTETVRQLGDPQEIVDAVLQDGTPQARAMRALQAELQETKRKADEGASAKTEIERLRAEVQQQAIERQIAEIRQTFLGQHATAERAPYAHTEYGGPEGVFARANEKALEWREQGLVLGKDFDLADVAQYIEREAKARFNLKLERLGLNLPQQVGGSASTTRSESGPAPKVSATGPRTLSAAQGSERRTSPKPLHQMSQAEQRQALIEEVARARRENPDANM